MKLNSLVKLALLPCLTFSPLTFASNIPTDWKDTKDGILQISGEGMYFWQSNNLASGYVIDEVDNNPMKFLSPKNPDPTWGYRATLTYIFPELQYDISASYWNVDANTNSTNLHGPVKVTEKNYYDFDAGELTIGKYLTHSYNGDLRIGVGLAYAHIKQTTKGRGELADPNLGDGYNDGKFYNRFKGLGPKIGLDGNVKLNNNFSLIGGLGASVLIGNAKAKAGVYEPDQPAAETSKTDRKTVFQTDAKAGIGLSQALGNDVALEVEAGYRGSIYFNALQHKNQEVIRDGVPIVFDPHNKNYSNYGPYAGLTISFK